MLSQDDAAAGTLAPAAAPSSAAELIKVVQQLWPEGLVSELVPGDEGVSSTRYAFVPSRRSARFLVPLPGRTAAGTTLRKYSAALSPREIAARAVMSMAFRAGGSSVLRDRVAVLGEHRSLRRFLSERFGTPVSFSISIGTARVNRKPVLQVFDARGRTLGYAKVGSTAQVIADIRAEAAALREVEGRLGPQIVAPRVLALEEWEGSVVLLLSPLAISMWQPLQSRWRPPTRHMQVLNEAFAEPDQLLPETSMWRGMAGSLGALVPGPRREALVELVAELEARSEGRAARVGAWHGDWTSWNMAASGRKVMLWDWERFERGVPAGMDQCHFLANAATREKGFTADVLLEALDGLQPAGQHLTAADLVVGAYLGRLALRYSEAAQGPGGHLITGRADVVTIAFDRWLTRRAA